MSIQTLKSAVQRGSLLSVAAAIAVATILPAGSVFADALNPLTERSLLLSSSAPGFTDTDGAGNAETVYSPPGSGPNGKKTGETFSFKVSTDSTVSGKEVKAFTLQYCVNAAGLCKAPGDNTGDADTANDGVAVGSDTTRESNATAHPLGRSDFEVVNTFTQATGTPTGGEFQIFVDGVADTTGWTMTTTNVEDTAHLSPLTGKKNFITLVKSAGIAPTVGQQIQIVFKASTGTYITNPGSGAFFVKLNTYNTVTTGDHIPGGVNNLDGGVTVANVMTDSIHITTKVLETMSFSVGTRNRDTKVVNCTVDPVNAPDCEGTSSVHTPCDPIQSPNGNRLNLGNPSAEYSLETDRAWDVNSYWRLSSNSSGGATVYYSGNTLANTVGDEIAEIGATKAINTPGGEQFGLAFVDAGSDTFDPVLSDPTTGLFTTQPLRFKVPQSFPFRTLIGQTTLQYDIGTLPAQPVSAQYNEGEGTLGTGGVAGTAKFAFQKSSLTVPVPIAQQNTQVISCATAKMRYVANIGADTPAGVYTTKINYLAAPQY